MKTVKTAKRPKTARAVRPNKGVEVAYRKRLDTMIADMSRSVEYWLEAAYKETPPKLAQDASPSDALSRRIAGLSKRWTKKFNDMSDGIASRFVKEGSRHTDASFMRSLKDAGWAIELSLTPAVTDAVNAVVNENVALIKSIPQQYFLEVEGIVMRGFYAGRDLGAISRQLQERHGVTKRRAAIIARDQSNKLTATVTRARRLEIGITKAIWVHSGAGVHPRPSHVKAGRDKLEFDVSEGAYLDGKYLQPGEAINCRCTSRTVLPF